MKLETRPMQDGRRKFIAGFGGFAFASGIYMILRRTTLASENPRVKKSTGPVKVVLFDDDGTKLTEENRPKVTKSDAEWQKQLNPEEYEVARHAGTEPAFDNPYFDNHAEGLYRCLCCATALFSSKTKFDSGTGWPSFWDPLAEENICISLDLSLGGTPREEVSCRLCDAHLGHVFTDGPPPTGLRYCMNSVSMRFIAHKQA